MKNKFIIGIFIIGLIYSVTGILFKFYRLEIGVVDGNIILAVGILTTIFAVILFFFKLHKKRLKSSN